MLRAKLLSTGPRAIARNLSSSTKFVLSQRHSYQAPSTCHASPTTRAKSSTMEIKGMTEKEQKKMNKEAEKAVKADRKRKMKDAEARGALYMLHWQSVATPGATLTEAAPSTVGAEAEAEAQTKQYLMALQDNLKRMEKVSKDALWYLTKEADDGMHVVLVTAKAKHAVKYNLVEIPEGCDTHNIQLGAAGPLDIPVAELRAMLLSQKQDKMGSMDSSDSEDEDMGDKRAEMALEVERKWEKEEKKRGEKKEKAVALCSLA